MPLHEPRRKWATHFLLGKKKKVPLLLPPTQNFLADAKRNFSIALTFFALMSWLRTFLVVSWPKVDLRMFQGQKKDEYKRIGRKQGFSKGSIELTSRVDQCENQHFRHIVNLSEPRRSQGENGEAKYESRWDDGSINDQGQTEDGSTINH